MGHFLFGGLNLPVSATRPLGRMTHNAGPDHVQIDIDKRPEKVALRLDGSSMIPILPECFLASLSVVVFLSSPTDNQLNCLGDGALAAIIKKKKAVGNVSNLTRDEMSISAGHSESNTDLNHFAIKMINGQPRGRAALCSPLSLRLSFTRRIGNLTAAVHFSGSAVRYYAVLRFRSPRFRPPLPRPGRP